MNATCVDCGSPLPESRTGWPNCNRCNWQKRPRVPCDICGGPTGYSAGRKASASCQECRRGQWEHGTRKGYRDHKCRCAECRAWGSGVVRKHRAAMRSKGIKLPGNSGPWINPATRLAVFARDELVCQLCGEPTEPEADPQSNWYPSLDHVVPQSKGGGHDAGNLRTAHRWCNSIRGAEDYHMDVMAS